MQQPRNHFFAGAGLTKDENLRVRASRRGYIVAQGDDAGTLADEDRGVDGTHERMCGL